MQTFPSLDAFGPRICICGPSNAGKSTLAVAIGRKLGAPAIHLDRFHHLPNSDWVPRPREDFARLHDAAIRGESWVMEGNYSRTMPQRMARATGIILLGSGRWPAFARYLRRTLFEKERAGNLAGAQDSIKWNMVYWILIRQPKQRAEDRKRLESYGPPMLTLRSMRELQDLYAAWELER